MGLAKQPPAVIWLLALLLLWTALWASTYPTGDFPQNDDWVYALAVRSILDHGRFALPSPSTANVVAQAYWGALFCLPAGFSFDALRLSTCVLGGVGVLTFFLLVREIGGSSRMAAVAALTLAANPLYLGLSTSFMTDVPFAALSAASLWLHVRSVRRNSTADSSAAYLAAFAAVLVRQFGLALFVAYGVGHLMRNRMSMRTWIVALAPIAAVVLFQISYEHWLVATDRVAHLPIPLSTAPPRVSLQNALRISGTALQLLPYLGLFTAPFLAALSGRLRRKSLLQGAGLAAGIFALLLAAGDLLPTFGNVLLLSGMGPRTLRDTWVLDLNKPPVTAGVAVTWLLLSALASAGLAAMLLVAARFCASVLRDFSQEARSRASLPATMLVVGGVTLAGTLLIATLAYPPNVFDRYILPLIVPTCAFLLLQRPPAGQNNRSTGRFAACVLLACFATWSVMATHDYLAWNRARWQATDLLVNSGISPRQVDGGYEFNGWLLNAIDYVRKPGKSFWWVDDDEYVIASGLISGYVPVDQVTVARWLPIGPTGVFILRRHP